jgi:flagellar hook-associated protein 2
VTLSDVKVYNPDLRGEYVAANPITLAGDANLTIDGIPVTRDSNTIDDLIPGVTLNLKRPTREALELSVSPDREAVKDEIITFVGYYNNLLAEVNILSGTDPSMVDQLDYYTDEEKEKAREKLGLYQGDSTLRQLKNRLQQIMMNPYETEANLDIRLLSQLGISTNSRPGGGVSVGQLRGYLEIDEAALDQSLENNFQAVKELFGFDSNGDLIVDTGAAHTLDEYLRSYVETGGILSYKVSTLDSRIDRTKDNIDDYNIRLEDKEAQLRRQYGTMEGALESMQRQSNALDNFSNNNQQGR